MFVTYAYGGERFVKLALLCVLSLQARRPGAEITVYTDNPAYFAGRGLTVKRLTKAEIAAGQAPVGYRHRVKIEVLLRHALEAPEGSPVIYIDSDTYYRGDAAHPPELGSRKWVMHNLDGLVGAEFYPRLANFLTREAALVGATPYRGMAPGFKMFNSGLVAFPVSMESLRLLHAARQMTDWLCVHFPEQNEWAEQIALAWIGESGPGVEADPMGFYHYWNQNTEVAALVARLDEKEIAAVASDPARFDALLREAAELAGDRWHRLTVLRKKRWDRSLRKRKVMKLARSLQERG